MCCVFRSEPYNRIINRRKGEDQEPSLVLSLIQERILTQSIMTQVDPDGIIIDGLTSVVMVRNSPTDKSKTSKVWPMSMTRWGCFPGDIPENTRFVSSETDIYVVVPVPCWTGRRVPVPWRRFCLTALYLFFPRIDNTRTVLETTFSTVHKEDWRFWLYSCTFIILSLKT